MPPFDVAHEGVQSRRVEQTEASHSVVYAEAYDENAAHCKAGMKDASADKFLPSVDLVEKTPFAAKVSPQAIEAAAKAIKDACSGFGTDEDKIYAVLNGLHSESERKALALSYKAKYGVDLVTELKDEMSGQELDKSLNLLNKKDNAPADDRAARIHETLIERNQTFEGRSDENCEKDIRDTLSTMNSKEIAALDKVYRDRYGVSLRDALMNGSGLSQETKAATEIYLQGSDKRTPEMTLKVADIALKSQNLEMFQEAMSMATPDARALFMKNNGEQKMHQAFSSSTDFEHAKNYATDGQLSTTSKITANSKWFNDNEEAIEKSIGEMSEKERANYVLGRDIAAGKNVVGLTNVEKQQALATYQEIHSALTKAGSDKEIKRWEDMIAVKGGSLVSTLAAHEGTIYDDSVNTVITDVENMSKSDWERLKNDPNYRNELEGSLDFLSDEEKAKVLKVLDAKQNSKTFEEAQGKRRSAQEVLIESAGFFNDDEESMYTAIEKMTPEEQKRYRDDAEYRKQIDEKLSSSLDEGAELDAAKALLNQVLEGKAPERDIIAKLNIHASKTNTDEAEAVRDIEQAFAKDPGLRDRINNPKTEEDRRLSGQFNEALHRAFDSDEYELYAKPLLTEGYLSMELKNKLNSGFFDDDEQGVYKDLTALASRKDEASIAERNRILNDADYQEKVLGMLSSEEQSVALNALMQGEMRPEDQIRSHMLGAGTDEEEIKEVISNLTPEEKLEVARLYAIKYGSDLSADLLDELGEQDARDIKRELQQPAKNAQEAFDRARDEYYESRDGIGSAIVDGAWDGTGYMTDASLSNYRAAMSKASSEFRELSPEEQKALSENLKENVDAFVTSKGAAADAIVDGVIIAAGVAGAGFTGGLSLTLLAQTAVAGALFKLAVKPAVVGADYDWSSSQVIVDGLIGAIDAASIVVGPAQLAQVFKLGEKCAATTAGKLLEEGSEQLIKTSTEASLNAASGAFGAGASGVIRSSAEWDSRKTASENLSMIAEQSAIAALSGAVLAGGLTVAGRFAGKTLGKASGASGSKVESTGSTLGVAGPVVPESRLPNLEFFTGDSMPVVNANVLTREDLAKPVDQLIAEQSLTWDASAKLNWKPTKASLKMREEAQEFVGHTMNGDFVQAIDSRLQTEVMHGIELNPPNRAVDVHISAADLLSENASLPQILENMSELAIFKWDQKIINGIPQDEELMVLIPRAVITTSDGNVPVALFDFVRTENGYKTVFPTKSLKGQDLTVGQLAEIEAIRKSVSGKRILAETALFTFEETFHAAQHMNGGKIISPSAAEHLRLPEVRIEERFRKIAFVSSVDSKLPLRSTLYEIEIPAILHDAGMPFSMIKEHYFFGRRHVKERTSVMNYLAKLASGELKIARNLQN